VVHDTKDWVKTMRRSTLVRLAALFALMALGCQRKASEVEARRFLHDASPSTDLTIQTKSGLIATGPAAQFAAIFFRQADGGIENQYALKFVGVDARDAQDSQSWNVRMLLTEPQVQAGSAEIQLVATGQAISEGQGEIWASYAPSGASGGTLSVTFGQGQIQGTVTAVPDEMSATFQGSIHVSCSVPPSMLDGGGFPEGAGLSDADGGEVGVCVSDPNLESPPCAALRQLAAP
jgi:hypothetical protein